MWCFNKKANDRVKSAVCGSTFEFWRRWLAVRGMGKVWLQRGEARSVVGYHRVEELALFFKFGLSEG